MDKIYIVRSYFEDYESSSWKIIGLFTDKKVADEIAKKWEDFYKEKKYSIFNEPKDWKPTEDDLEYSEGTWEESYEYSNRCAMYSEVLIFREIEVDEFDLNKDLSLNRESLKLLGPYITESMLSLMTQWDRNHKLEKIIK
jgi:hypothetical protein